MKKNYLLMMAGSLLLSGVANGQSSQEKLNYSPLEVKKHSNFYGIKNKTKAKAEPQEKGALLWEDDFSDPNTWVMSNTSQPQSWDWTIETDPTSIPENQADAPELFPFESSTANNGFGLINSDGQPNNADGDGAIVAEITNATPIDLSGSPYVTLSFEHNYRWWQDTRGVRVSGDNGLTWTEFVITDEVGPDDQNSDNPEITQIDISSVAGDSSQVLIQFYYDDNDYWAWYWAVDDVKINEADPFDLRNEGIYWGAAGNIGVRVPYYQVPLDQVTAYDVSGRVANAGYNDQNDVIYTTSVTSQGFTSVSSPSTVLAFETDTVDCNSQFTPLALGEYIFDGSVTSTANDPTPADNSIAGVDTMEVTNYIYARDNNLIDGGFFPEVSYEGGNLFDINQDADLYAIDAAFGNSLGEGIEVYGTLHSIDANGEFQFEAETEYYTTQAGDENTMRTFEFSNPVSLTAGTTYLVTLGSFSTELSLAVAGNSPDQTSFLYGDLGTNGVDWYYTNSTPVVRMNFDPSLSAENVKDVEANVSIYPNPANEESTINFSLENASDVEVTVTDLSGKAVYTTALENASAGQHSIAIPTVKLSNGVYLINYTAGNAVAAKKLVVNK